MILVFVVGVCGGSVSALFEVIVVIVCMVWGGLMVNDVLGANVRVGSIVCILLGGLFMIGEVSLV